MNKSVYVCFLFCLGFVSMGLAQKGPFEDDEIKSRYLRGNYTHTASSPGINGSPFLKENFQNGLLFFEGKVPIQALLRYHVIKEEIQVSLGENNYSVIQDKIDVRIGNEDFKKMNFRDQNDDLLLGYFKIINAPYENNKLLLLEKPTKKLREGQEAGAMRPATDDQYVDKTDLYLKLPKSNVAVVSERKTKKFLALFPNEHKEKMKKYMDENDLKPKRESDLKKIVEYYNNNFKG